MRQFFFFTIFIFLGGSILYAQPVAFPQLTLGNSKEMYKQNLASTPFISLKKDSASLLPLQNNVPINFYSTHLGAACKMELQLEKQTKLPIRIRLGSKEQVDYLEGKFSRNR